MARNCTFKYTQINSDGKSIPFTTELTKEKEVITTLRKKNNVNLLFYYLYVFDKNYALCQDKDLRNPSLPKWMVPATPNEKKMIELSASEYDFNKNKISPPAFVYLSGRELSASEVELFKTEQTSKNKCIPVPSSVAEIALDQSFSVWNCYAHKVADPAWKAEDLISNLIDLYSGQYKKKENAFTELLKENRYVIARGGVPVDMKGVLTGLSFNINTGTVLSTHINSVTTEVAAIWGKIKATSPDRSVFALWESKIKTSIDPLYMLGILYAQTMTRGWTVADMGSLTSAQELLSKIEEFMFDDDRDMRVQTTFDQTIASVLTSLTAATDSALASVPILHSAYARKIATSIPKVSTNLIRYYDAGYMSVTKVDADTKKPFLFSQIIPNESYTEFTVYFYDKNGSPTPIDSKKFQDVKNTDTDLQNAALNSPIWIRTYGKVFFAQLTEIMDKAQMFEKGQCLKFVAEMSHQVYKKMTFIDQSHYMIAFASIAESFAICFNTLIEGNDRAINYSRGGIDTLDRNRQCNAKPAIDCQGFVNTCLYILGATYQNICDQDDTVTEKAVSDEMKNLDDNGLPWAIRPVKCWGYAYKDDEDIDIMPRKCDAPGVPLYGTNFTVDGSITQKKFLNFVEEQRQKNNDYKNTKLKYGSKDFEKFLSVLSKDKNATLYKSFSTNITKSTCFYRKDDYYSNGVRQILSNLHGLFDTTLSPKTGFNLKTALSDPNTTCEGMVVISRLEDPVISTWDYHGHAKAFRGDFPDHVYIIISENRIAQSGGIDAGVNIKPLNDVTWLTDRSPFALRLKYPR